MKQLKILPEPITRQILLRFGGAAILLILSVILGIAYNEFSFTLSAMLISIVLIAMGFHIMYKAGKDEYLVIKGTCRQIEKTSVRKRIKSIIICADPSSTVDDREVLMRLQLRKKRTAIWEGCRIEIYLDKQATLYERDGLHVVDRFLSLRIIQ